MRLCSDVLGGGVLLDGLLGLVVLDDDDVALLGLLLPLGGDGHHVASEPGWQVEEKENLGHGANGKEAVLRTVPHFKHLAPSAQRAS